MVFDRSVAETEGFALVAVPVLIVSAIVVPFAPTVAQILARWS